MVDVLAFILSLVSKEVFKSFAVAATTMFLLASLLQHCESISVHACRKTPLLTFAGYVLNDDPGLLYKDSLEQEEWDKFND